MGTVALASRSAIFPVTNHRSRRTVGVQTKSLRFLALSVITFTPILATASPRAPQACTIAGGGVGQPSSIVCKDIATGDTTQTVAVAPVVSAAGGVGGNLVRHRDSVLVTNQHGGAAMFEEQAGRLTASASLNTGGEDSLSGYLTDEGAYVVTPKRLLFFRHGARTATSSAPLLAGDGSAAQVVVTGHYAYVSEKSGSLEAFQLSGGGELAGPATAVAGVTPGVIVGIAKAGRLVVAPIAHLASNPAQAAISVVGRTSQLQHIDTKEAAACWAKGAGEAVCVTNPGSMTVSCGHAGDDALASFTEIATTTTGASGFDLDLRDDLVAIQATAAGHPMLLIYSREEHSDFLGEVGRIAIDATAATGALLLPPIGH